MVAGMARFCLVNSCKISHFGINPESGGSPPRESNIINEIMDRRGDLTMDIAIELILVELSILNSRKAVMVIIIYNVRLSWVKLGE